MDQKIATNHPQHHGGIATAEAGIVMLDGPNGVAVAMSPEAAEVTGQSLLAAAREAALQRGEPHSN